MRGAEFRNLHSELARFRVRLWVAMLFCVVCMGLIITRLAWLQLVQHQHYAAQADENRISVVPVPPNRGLIYDRNGHVLARNYSAYTLELTPSKVGNLEATIEALREVVDIEPRDLRRFRRLQEDARRFETLPLKVRLSDEEVARFAAQSFRFPGVEIRARLFRQYPMGTSAAHVLGYIGRISPRDLERLEAQGEEVLANYRGAEGIGKEGLEKRYERWLHGQAGFEQVEVTAGGRPVRTLSRTPPTPGHNLYLSLDIGLQQFAESAFAGRRGALVAIEPRSGDVLAFVSSPSFDPNLFVDGIDSENWKLLNESPDKPLINRPLFGTYPIGSTYKPFMALAALETGKRTPEAVYNDPGFFIFGGHRFRDSGGSGYGAVNVHRSIVVSSDVYYYQLAADMGVDVIHDFMKPWGFGQITGIDLDGEKRGILPSTDWKRRAFRTAEQQRWYGGDTISIGIGQGYNSFTLLQLAHATATLANGGTVMKPHLVRQIEDPVSGERRGLFTEPSHVIPLNPENVRVIRRAMVDVNKIGTGARVFAGAPYEVAGKTGTAQVFSLRGQKYDANRIDERLRDHSLYIAFAPAENPTIAMAVLVENGGFGSAAAAPVARKVFDYWLIERGMDHPDKLVQAGARP